MGPRAIGDEGEHACEHGGEPVAEQHKIDEGPADRLAGEQGIFADAQAEHDHDKDDGGKEPRAEIVDDAAALQAHALEPDHHGEQERDIEGGLGERARDPVRVSREVMPNLEHDQHDGEEDRGGIDDPRRHVVGAPPQHVASEPEGNGRHAVAVEQPVEDRPRADPVADDARVPGDAAEHADGDGGGKPAERRPRPLLGDPGDAGDHQRERDGEPALLQR